MNFMVALNMFKILLLLKKKKKIINKLSSLLTKKVNFDSVVEYILRVIHNRAKTKRTPGDAWYTKLFVKGKGKKRKFTGIYRLLPDE